MRKNIRFPLKMKYNVEVRTLEELRENFSLERILIYMSNSKLITWLRDRNINDIADKIENLDKNDSKIINQIFGIFNIKDDEQQEVYLLEATCLWAILNSDKKDIKEQKIFNFENVPLKMKGDVEVRTLEELRENFSLERILIYMSNGKLVAWLRNLCMDVTACKIKKVLDENYNMPILNILEIFNIDFNEIGFEILDCVANTQEMLEDLINKGKKVIYLSGFKFFIPLITSKNIIYIGTNYPIVRRGVEDYNNFIANNITFWNVCLVSPKKYNSLDSMSKEEIEELKEITKLMQKKPMRS